MSVSETVAVASEVEADGIYARAAEGVRIG